MARGMPADLDKALADVMALFRKDAAAYELAVERAVKVPLDQHQFDALVSFHYNTGAIAMASLVKKLNAGDYAGAGAGLMAWVKPPEITERRKSERDLFLTGAYPGGAVTVWGVTDAGKVIWKTQRRLNMPQFMALISGAVAASKPVVAPPAPEPKESLWAALFRALFGTKQGKAK
jgi:lysozyme